MRSSILAQRTCMYIVLLFPQFPPVLHCTLLEACSPLRPRTHIPTFLFNPIVEEIRLRASLLLAGAHAARLLAKSGYIDEVAPHRDHGYNAGPFTFIPVHRIHSSSSLPTRSFCVHGVVLLPMILIHTFPHSPLPPPLSQPRCLHRRRPTPLAFTLNPPPSRSGR